jgi:(p)ppGpp synthase/HD superfamily hydrolase
VDTNDTVLEKRLRDRLGEAPGLAAALALARRVHEGQLRDEGTPYIAHPLRVALILVEEAGVVDLEMVAAALLHDALEDDPSRTAEELESVFGARVARLVVCLTDEFKHSGLPRDQRKPLYLKRIAGASEDCLTLKLCDRIDNVRCLGWTTNVVKKERMKTETRAYLLPALTGRSGTLLRLAGLLEEALT